MAEYNTPIDIANRALQHLGAKRIDPVLGFNEQSKQASECSFAYGKLRRAELRRNIWRFSVRRTILRPVNSLAVQGVTFVTNPSAGNVGSPTMMLAPALWSSGTTYSAGTLVTDIANVIWQSLAPANVGYAPGNSSAWEQYTGPLTVDAYVSGTTYQAGDLVYVAPGDGSYAVYESLTAGNTDDPATPSAYSATQIYAKDEVVTSGGTPYQSLVDLNYGNTPASSPTQWTTTITSGSGSVKWRALATALQPMVIMYPAGTGPAFQTATRNLYRLPHAWLREAPQDPKAGSNSVLGAPSGLLYNDWNYDGDYIITRETGGINYRFVADVTNVTKMDDMFCEGLAARLAYEICEAITQSTVKQQACATAYAKFMGEARTVNSIEEGSVEPPLDDWSACRA